MTEEQTQQEQKAEAAASRLLALWSLYEAGRISLPDFQIQGAAIVYAAKIAASRLADVAVSMLANRPALGISPGPQHVERLRSALEAITEAQEPEGQEDPSGDESGALTGIPAQLERLTLAEAQTSSQKSQRAAIEAHGFSGYREQVAEDACEVCLPYEGEEHEVEEDWEPHHPRCRCELVPVGDPAPQTPETAEEPLFRTSKEVRRYA